MHAGCYGSFLPSYSVEKIFHIWGPGPWWQKCPKTVQGFQLPVDHQSQTLHLHHADETWWGYFSRFMQGGIKFSSTCLILRDERMVRITLRRSEWPFMPIVESGGFTFQIVCTAKKSCRQNLSCFCPFRNNSEGVIFVGCFLLDVIWVGTVGKMFYFLLSS